MAPPLANLVPSLLPCLALAKQNPAGLLGAVLCPGPELLHTFLPPEYLSSLPLSLADPLGLHGSEVIFLGYSDGGQAPQNGL